MRAIEWDAVQISIEIVGGRKAPWADIRSQGVAAGDSRGEEAVARIFIAC